MPSKSHSTTRSAIVASLARRADPGLTRHTDVGLSRWTRDNPQVATGFPIGASVRLEQLEGDPHALLARLREREPVSWLPALDGWLVTRHDLAEAVMRDASTFTVDDPRFSTARVVGVSMLSLDGERHARHRSPFVAPFRITAVRDRFQAPVAIDAEELLAALPAAPGAELRRAFAGPLAARIVSRALGLRASEVDELLGWYDTIVAGVTAITAGEKTPAPATEAFEALSDRLMAVINGADRSSLLATAAAGGELTAAEVVSNAAVLLFGGIETTEGMIVNAIRELLQHPSELPRARESTKALDAVIEESLRLEPAAAAVDRYATAGVRLGGALLAAGNLVRVSITAANRDPAVFARPDEFDLGRTNARRHLAFAQGPHICLGVHLARLEARVGIGRLLARFPALRLDVEQTAPAARGLVFRKPPALHVLLD